MTDFVQDNLEFWRQQTVFHPLFEAGILDMAIYDIQHPGALTLQQCGTVLSKGEVGTPITVISNYLFDSTRQDAFHISDYQLYESLITWSFDKRVRTPILLSNVYKNANKGLC
ncbi:MAG: hypothetical protein GY782_02005 [Gammaproteobacteria bacterium]|nr:hypothetical protein [Gammaproteobacteria bacterium]